MDKNVEQKTAGGRRKEGGEAVLLIGAGRAGRAGRAGPADPAGRQPFAGTDPIRRDNKYDKMS